MATTPTATSPSSSRSHSESRATRVNRRTTSSPRANPYPNPSTTSNTSARARRRADARRWGWLPTSLATWRIEEGIEIPTETEEFSPMDISPYTQEPTHFTVPVLAARLHRHENRLGNMQKEQHHSENRLHCHERRLHDLEIEQEETRTNWIHMAQGTVNQIYQDQEDITDTMGIVHNQVIGNSNEISVLQTRLVQCETRIRETEDHTRSLEQRLAMAEETLRMVDRLTDAMQRVVTLLPPPNPRQD